MRRVSTSFARIKYGGQETVVKVVVAEEGDVAVPGLVALKNVGYRVNSITGQLECVELPAA